MLPRFYHILKAFPVKFSYLIALLSIAGCADGTFPVTGKVIYKGTQKHVSQAIIVLEALDHSHSVSGEVDIVGEFRLAVQEKEGCPPGDYKVLLSDFNPNPESGIKATIPEKYSSFETTDLKCTVMQEPNHFVFEIDEPESSIRVIPPEKPKIVE